MLHRFEKLSEFLGWLRIVVSFTLIGAGIGAGIYYPEPNRLRFIIGTCIAAIGVLHGIIVATPAWKGKGTMWLLSRTIASPELDRDSSADRQAKIKK